MSERTTADWLADGERRSQWALAHIMHTWKNDMCPLIRKAYNGTDASKPTDADLCDRLAERLEGFARTARRAAELAREENAL